MMDRLIDPLCQLAANPTAQSLTLGFSAAILGIITTMVTSSKDQFRGIDLLQELIDIENANKNQTLANSKYEEMIEIFSVVLALGALFFAGLFVLVGVLFWRIRAQKWLISDCQTEMTDLKATLNHFMAKEDELFYNISVRLQKESDTLNANLNTVVKNGMLQIEEMVAKFQTKMKACRQNIKGELNKFDTIKEVSEKTEQNLGKFESSLSTYTAKMQRLEQQSANLKKTIDQYVSQVDIKAELMDKEHELAKIRICKCNLMLTNSQILLEKILGNMDGAAEVSLSDVLKDLDRDFSLDSDTYFKAYCESTDLTLVDISKKLETVQSTLGEHDDSIKKTRSSIEDVRRDMREELRQFTSRNEQWIYNWISVLYGLFSSDIAQLQIQLLGLDDLDSLRKLEETGAYLKDECVFIENFIFECKKQCFGLLRELSLLLFEFYLLKTEYLSQNQILEECDTRIETTVARLFELFQTSLQNSSMSHRDSQNLSTTICKFQEKLVADLKLTCSNFNVIFKQNIEDFFIIFKTLKDMDERLPSDEDSSVLINNRHSFSDDDAVTSNSSDSWGLDDASAYKPLRLVEKRTVS
ncbi:hypothetical protein KL951_004335 [Ogataea haglerorum]|nr:hypothetical protein KL951_004335 [Ogataea haglerorum]